MPCRDCDVDDVFEGMVLRYDVLFLGMFATTV